MKHFFAKVLIFSIFLFNCWVQCTTGNQRKIPHTDAADFPVFSKFLGSGTTNHMETRKRSNQYRQNAMGDGNIGRFTAGGSIKNKLSTLESMMDAVLSRGIQTPSQRFFHHEKFILFFFHSEKLLHEADLVNDQQKMSKFRHLGRRVEPPQELADMKSMRFGKFW